MDYAYLEEEEEVIEIEEEPVKRKPYTLPQGIMVELSVRDSESIIKNFVAVRLVSHVSSCKY